MDENNPQVDENNPQEGVGRKRPPGRGLEENKPREEGLDESTFKVGENNPQEGELDEDNLQEKGWTKNSP